MNVNLLIVNDLFRGYGVDIWFEGWMHDEFVEVNAIAQSIDYAVSIAQYALLIFFDIYR